MQYSHNLMTLPLLPVPQTAVARHPDAIVRPTELRNWLRQLPLAAPGRLADLVLLQLTHLVRDPNPSGHFRTLLHTYQASLHALQLQVWGAIQPNRGHRKNIGNLQNCVSQLLLETSYGHTRLVNQHIAAGTPPDVSDLFHALLPLTRLIQWDLLQYNLMRPSIWQQALQLYSVAELYRLSGVEVSSRLTVEADAHNVHGNFHAALALQLCDPYRLPHPQVRKLMLGLSELAQYLSTTTDTASQQRIAVDLAGDLPPRRFALGAKPQTPLFLQLDEFLDQLQRDGLPDDENGELAQWLRSSLLALCVGSNGAEVRRQQRQFRQADYHFQVGLKTVQQRLQELLAPNGATAPEQEGGILVDDGFVSHNPQLGIPCRQKDLSDDGAGFMLHANVQPPMVGELALFEADARDSALSGLGFVARVRRQLRREDGSHEIGVEKLKGNLIPVAIGVSRTPALLHTDRASRHWVLIAPPDTFVVNAQLTLYSPQQTYKVRCQELLEQQKQQYIRVSLE